VPIAASVRYVGRNDRTRVSAGVKEALLRIAFLLEVFGSLVMVPLTVRRGPSVRHQPKRRISPYGAFARVDSVSGDNPAMPRSACRRHGQGVVVNVAGGLWVDFELEFAARSPATDAGSCRAEGRRSRAPRLHRRQTWLSIAIFRKRST
jgi:hypothetical protein